VWGGVGVGAGCGVLLSASCLCFGSRAVRLVTAFEQRSSPYQATYLQQALGHIVFVNLQLLCCRLRRGAATAAAVVLPHFGADSSSGTASSARLRRHRAVARLRCSRC